MVDIYLKPIAILKYPVQSARLNQHWDLNHKSKIVNCKSKLPLFYLSTLSLTYAGLYK